MTSGEENEIDRLAGIPQSESFLRELDAWRLAQHDELSRDVALWVLACGFHVEESDHA